MDGWLDGWWHSRLLRLVHFLQFSVKTCLESWSQHLKKKRQRESDSSQVIWWVSQAWRKTSIWFITLPIEICFQNTNEWVVNQCHQNKFNHRATTMRSLKTVEKWNLPWICNLQTLAHGEVGHSGGKKKNIRKTSCDVAPVQQERNVPVEQRDGGITAFWAPFISTLHWSHRSASRPCNAAWRKKFHQPRFKESCHRGPRPRISQTSSLPSGLGCCVVTGLSFEVIFKHVLVTLVVATRFLFSQLQKDSGINETVSKNWDQVVITSH